MNNKSITPKFDILGAARFIGTYESGTPEWHSLRSTGIGGSDVAAVCRISPWSSPFKVWAVKTGRLPADTVSSEAAEWGHRLEAVVLDKFEEMHPELIVHRNVGTFQNLDRAFQLANPDAIYETAEGRFGIIEVKTSRFEDDWQNDSPPIHYQAQVQWYDQTFGFQMPIYVAALFSGSKYREYVIEPDVFAQSVYLSEVEKFMGYLEADIQPDFDGSMATLTTVRELHPEIDPEADCELGDLGVHYFNALSDLDEVTAKANELKARVFDAMGNAKRGLIDDRHVLTRQSRNGGTPFLVQKRG